MADGEQTEEQTVSMTDYKSLQRKFDRASKKAAKAEERAESLESGQTRSADFMQELAAILTEGDAEATAKVATLINTTETRQTADTSAAQLTARLNQTLDDAGEDWDDAKFDSARTVLDEINKSGDMARGYEAERLIRDAIKGDGDSNEGTTEEKVQAAVDAAVLKDRQDHGRVDTQDSAATTAGGQVTPQDLSSMNPKTQGTKAMREINEKALSQLTGQ